jgi:hypothetical protein
MLHPRLTSVDGTQTAFLAQIGPYGSWGDLSYVTRWGDGASGMYESQWTMPLPADYTHPLLRRGTLVELMDGPHRVGSPLILAEPTVGSGLADPWQFTANGIGREVEGENSFYCFDGSGNATSIASTAIDQAITRGLRWSGRASSIPTTALGPTTTEQLNTIGALLNSIGASTSKRWGVGQDNIVAMYSDPTTPTWQTTPGSAALGVADDDYATVVFVRYVDSATGLYSTSTAPASVSSTETRVGRREFPVDVTSLGPISTATANGFSAGILANAKGRLGWTNGLTLTSNQLLTTGGVPAELSMVEAGQMLRIHGIFNDLLEYNGQTWTDIIIGQTRYTDGAQSIQIDPLDLAARDLAAIVEAVTGVGDAAA